MLRNTTNYVFHIKTQLNPENWGFVGFQYYIVNRFNQSKFQSHIFGIKTLVGI